MEYGIVDFLKLIGSLGLFIYGMKVMSEGLQKAAGEGMRKILRTMTSTRFSGILTGFLVTSLVQSSSATTVMVVSFVNAGLLTLSESMGVIMGANIGTTVTAWIISYFGFKFKIGTIALILIGLFFPLMFSKRSKLNSVAEFMIGFGILFIGLGLLKDSVPDIKGNPEMLAFVQAFADRGFLSTLLFIAIGTILTVVIQSSSATMAVTLVLLAQGWISFPIAAAMVLGENIGTTITANLAALVGNVYAKRAARFHFIFNVFGVLWMLGLMSFFLQGIDKLAMSLSEEQISVFSKTDAARENATLALALFHTTFNILNVLLLVWLVPFLEKVVVKMVPSKGDEDEEFRLKYISSGLMSTAELSLVEARKELKLFGKLIEKMSYNVSALLFQKPKNPEHIIDKIKRREEITDNLELELADYLSQIVQSDISASSSQRVHGILSIANDLERVADIYYEMTRNFQRMQKLEVVLPEDALKELEEHLSNVYASIILMRENLEKDSEDIDLNEVYELENEINKATKKMVKLHYKRLEKNIYKPKVGVIYLDFVNRAERIGDHMVNVSEAMAGLK